MAPVRSVPGLAARTVMSVWIVMVVRIVLPAWSVFVTRSALPVRSALLV